MRLEFSASAVRELVRLRFIAVHNPGAAKRISLRLQQTIGKVVLHPDMGRSILELEHVRELIAGDYVVRYSRSDYTVSILRVWL